VSKIGFNLLKAQMEPVTVWTKLYDWIVGTARIVVIVVEIIVVVAFGIRLIIDIQGKMLDEQIENKENTLSYYVEAERRYKVIQDKTSAFKMSWVNSTLHNETFFALNEILPETPSDISMSISEEAISVSGEATVAEIGDLETDFKESDVFKDTELANIISEGDSPQAIAEFVIRSTVNDLQKREIVVEESEN